MLIVTQASEVLQSVNVYQQHLIHIAGAKRWYYLGMRLIVRSLNNECSVVDGVWQHVCCAQYCSVGCTELQDSA